MLDLCFGRLTILSKSKDQADRMPNELGNYKSAVLKRGGCRVCTDWERPGKGSHPFGRRIPAPNLS
ncbi:MAG: hypothetical protein WBC88_12875 [Candidatus Zixiibacteriota bacterium]